MFTFHKKFTFTVSFFDYHGSYFDFLQQNSMHGVSAGNPAFVLNNQGEPAAPNLQGDNSLTNIEEITAH